MAPRRERRAVMAAVRSHLPRRTVRLRLTLLYGGLFLAAGAALLAMTYLLVERNTDVPAVLIPGDEERAAIPPTSQRVEPGGAVSTRSPATEEILRAVAIDQNAEHKRELIVQSGVALAGMAVLSMGLGWFVAGRVLRPLRTITSTARSISTSNLRQRLTLDGPDDEVKELGDTFDDLLDRLQAAFEAQRHFVANASHELRTPLTLSRALLQMTLTDPHATLESFRATCQEVVAVGEDQERLIEALLVLARSERGLDHREPLDLSVVGDDVLLTRQPEIERLHLELSTELDRAPIDGDSRLAERLVVNLVDNALRHNVANGRIEVATGSRAGRAYLSVTNSGPVVPPDEVDRLFEPFQRLSADSTPNADGVGLGLAIVRAIADAHGANIAVAANVDGGLHIEVTFPEAAGAEAASPPKHGVGHSAAVPTTVSNGAGPLPCCSIEEQPGDSRRRRPG
jgi:signal transduction histidine kinase